MTISVSAHQSKNVEQALLDEYAGRGNLDNIIPQLARDEHAMQRIEAAVRQRSTSHELILGDSRVAAKLKPGSLHLVVTSPPYWTLKKYNDGDDQLGHVAEYDEFIAALDSIWKHCYEALVPGGRLIINVGDVCLSRRRNKGRHTVVPLHATIQEHCKQIGFDNLAPIIWHKISNAKYEAEGSGGFLGKPYEPNAVIKNDIEFVLMQRKPGGYRSPTRIERLLSIVPADLHKVWFRQIWSDITGASTARHPAPFPEALVERLIRMFSFVGDTVLDPFMGTATTNYVAAQWGRNSIGIEVDSSYYMAARKRMAMFNPELFSSAAVTARSVREASRA